MKLLIKLALNTFTLLIVAYLVPGFYLADLWAGIVSGVVIGIVNTFIKPVLQIVAFPISILTFGIAAFLINVFLLWGVSFIVPGFDIENFFAGKNDDLVPFQIARSWRYSGFRRMLGIMVYPHVALPHAAVLVIGIALYIYHRLGLFQV